MLFPKACLLQNASAFTGTQNAVLWLSKVMHNIYHAITYIPGYRMLDNKRAFGEIQILAQHTLVSVLKMPLSL